MKISLIGYGKMGREIEKVAKLSKDFEIYSTIDPVNTDAMFREIDGKSIGGAEVCIDFTSPDSVIDNIRKVAALRKNMVVGTTGWYDSLREVESMVRESDVSLLYAPNFSLGVNAYYLLLARSGEMLQKLGYAVAMVETHHSQKSDAPSGTAKKIREILEGLGYDEVQIASVRVGSVVGNHETIFDSHSDSIEITHRAKSRDGFAKGALEAAHWIKNRKGVYTIDEMLNEMFGE